MMRFNRETHEYEFYSKPVPDGNYPIYTNNMEEIINCCQCGKEITFGEGYGSQEIYTGPWSHIVCEECRDKELERIRKIKAKEAADDNDQ
jgi:ribosomal protein L44E